MEETFRKIDGYENYEISDHGNVRNTKTGRTLKNKIRKDNYSEVGLPILINGKNKQNFLKIHRLIGLAFIDNPENKKCIDHVDCDRQNNHVSNLRWATHTENQQNSSIHKNSTSGVKGVSFQKRTKKFKATIMLDGLSIHLGYFENLEDAKAARIKKANDVFGNFVHQSEKILIV
jgi:hypothetical protein